MAYDNAVPDRVEPVVNGTVVSEVKTIYTANPDYDENEMIVVVPEETGEEDVKVENQWDGETSPKTGDVASAAALCVIALMVDATIVLAVRKARG